MLTRAIREARAVLAALEAHNVAEANTAYCRLGDALGFFDFIHTPGVHGRRGRRRHGLDAGDAPDVAPLSIVAHEFHFDPRTMRRHLKAAGIAIRDVGRRHLVDRNEVRRWWTTRNAAPNAAR